MSRPLIGITCGVREDDEREFYTPSRYCDCVEAAGGLPVIMPVLPPAAMEDLLARLQGLVIIGGLDLPPDYYGEELNGSEQLVPRLRADFDLALIRAAVARNTPLIGICYGHQAIAVAFGGKLLQDISSRNADAIPHRKQPGEDTVLHEVCLDSSSRLAGILASDHIESASSHHQSVCTLGAGWRAVATAPDGILEAAEREGGGFQFSLQWHPEMTPEAEPTRRLFRALVEAAARG